jgi:hypothetical protein
VLIYRDIGTGDVGTLNDETHEVMRREGIYGMVPRVTSWPRVTQVLNDERYDQIEQGIKHTSAHLSRRDALSLVTARVSLQCGIPASEYFHM